jgi:hypothetical protein
MGYIWIYPVINSARKVQTAAKWGVLSPALQVVERYPLSAKAALCNRRDMRRGQLQLLFTGIFKSTLLKSLCIVSDLAALCWACIMWGTYQFCLLFELHIGKHVCASVWENEHISVCPLCAVSAYNLVWCTCVLSLLLWACFDYHNVCNYTSIRINS